MTMIRSALLFRTKLALAVLGLCLGLFLPVLLAAPAAAQGWLRADTPNFVIYSDGYPHELERWARKVEMFDAALRLYFKRPEGRKGARLTIYMLKDEKAVARLAGQKYLAGFYSPSSEGSFAVTNRKPTYYKQDMSGQQTLFHEYAHHFMYRHFPAAYPAWYREGFAEYVATVQFDADGYWSFGLPASHRQKRLDTDPLPIETILFSDASQLKAKRRSTFYAWSWLLVHMLNSDPARADQLRTYLDRFSDGADPRKAAAVFGDLETLESQLKVYAQSAQRHSRSTKPIATIDDIAISTLDPLASRLVELGLMRRAGRNLENTRKSLRALARAYPRHPDVQVELALAERDIARKARPEGVSLAEQAVDRALAAHPDHARANVIKASLTIRRLSRSRDRSSPEWANARARLVSAVRQSPEDALPYLRLYSSYSRQRTRPPEGAHRAIAKAFALQPEASDIRLAYAVSLALQGQHDQANALARVLASDPHAAHLGKRALAVLARIKAARPARSAVKTAQPSGTP